MGFGKLCLFEIVCTVVCVRVCTRIQVVRWFFVESLSGGADTTHSHFYIHVIPIYPLFILYSHQCCFRYHIYVLRIALLMCGRLGQCIDKEEWGPI